MRVLLVLIMAGLYVLNPFSSAQASSLKIAVIDIQECLNESLEGKRAKKVLEAKNAKLKARLEAAQEEVNRLKDEIEKQGLMLSPTVLKDKERDYRRKQRELQDMLRDFNEEMRLEEEDMKIRIFKDLDVLLQKIASREGFDMVLERRSVLFATQDVDITQMVIKEYDAMKGRQ